MRNLLFRLFKYDNVYVCPFVRLFVKSMGKRTCRVLQYCYIASQSISDKFGNTLTECMVQTKKQN